MFDRLQYCLLEGKTGRYFTGHRTDQGLPLLSESLAQAKRYKAAVVNYQVAQGHWEGYQVVKNP